MTPTRKQSTLDPTDLAQSPNLPTASMNSFVAAAAGLPLPSGAGIMKHDGILGGFSLDGEPVAPDSRFFTSAVSYGYKYLQSGHRAEDYPEAVGQPFRGRDSLPHQDQSLWDLGDDNEPIDPIKQYIRLSFVALSSGQLSDYEAFAPSARRAVTEFVRRVAWEAGTHNPAARTFLTLATRQVPAKRRPIYVPVFNIACWLVPGPNGTWRPEDQIIKPSTGTVIDDALPW